MQRQGRFVPWFSAFSMRKSAPRNSLPCGGGGQASFPLLWRLRTWRCWSPHFIPLFSPPKMTLMWWCPSLVAYRGQAGRERTPCGLREAMGCGSSCWQGERLPCGQLEGGEGLVYVGAWDFYAIHFWKHTKHDACLLAGWPGLLLLLFPSSGSSEAGGRAGGVATGVGAGWTIALGNQL